MQHTVIKRSLTLLLALALVFSAIPAAFAASFSDVPDSKWYAAYVEYATEHGFMSGVGNNKFDPNGKLTRAQVVTILYSLAGSPDVSGLTVPFTDLKDNSYYVNPVIWAYNAGVVSGVSSAAFGPGNPITREQIAVMTAQYVRYTCGYLPEDENLNAIFIDQTSIASWAKSAVAQMVRAGMMSGKGSATFDPKGQTTRAEAAAIFSNLDQKIVLGTGTVTVHFVSAETGNPIDSALLREDNTQIRIMDTTTNKSTVYGIDQSSTDIPLDPGSYQVSIRCSYQNMMAWDFSHYTVSVEEGKNTSVTFSLSPVENAESGMAVFEYYDVDTGKTIDFHFLGTNSVSFDAVYNGSKSGFTVWSDEYPLNPGNWRITPKAANSNGTIDGYYLPSDSVSFEILPGETTHVRVPLKHSSLNRVYFAYYDQTTSSFAQGGYNITAVNTRNTSDEYRLTYSPEYGRTILNLPDGEYSVTVQDEYQTSGSTLVTDATFNLSVSGGKTVYKQIDFRSPPRATIQFVFQDADTGSVLTGSTFDKIYITMLYNNSQKEVSFGRPKVSDPYQEEFYMYTESGTYTVGSIEESNLWTVVDYTPSVTVAPGETAVITVKLRMNPLVGYVKLHVVDAVTGQPVDDWTVDMTMYEFTKEESQFDMMYMGYLNDHVIPLEAGTYTVDCYVRRSNINPLDPYSVPEITATATVEPGETTVCTIEVPIYGW